MPDMPDDSCPLDLNDPRHRKIALNFIARTDQFNAAVGKAATLADLRFVMLVKPEISMVHGKAGLGANWWSCSPVFQPLVRRLSEIMTVAIQQHQEELSALLESCAEEFEKEM